MGIWLILGFNTARLNDICGKRTDTLSDEY